MFKYHVKYLSLLSRSFMSYLLHVRFSFKNKKSPTNLLAGTDPILGFPGPRGDLAGNVRSTTDFPLNTGCKKLTLVGSS